MKTNRIIELNALYMAHIWEIKVIVFESFSKQYADVHSFANKCVSGFFR